MAVDYILNLNVNATTSDAIHNLDSLKDVIAQINSTSGQIGTQMAEAMASAQEAVKGTSTALKESNKVAQELTKTASKISKDTSGIFSETQWRGLASGISTLSSAIDDFSEGENFTGVTTVIQGLIQTGMSLTGNSGMGLAISTFLGLVANGITKLSEAEKSDKENGQNISEYLEEVRNALYKFGDTAVEIMGTNAVSNLSDTTVSLLTQLEGLTGLSYDDANSGLASMKKDLQTYVNFLAGKDKDGNVIEASEKDEYYNKYIAPIVEAWNSAGYNLDGMIVKNDDGSYSINFNWDDMWNDTLQKLKTAQANGDEEGIKAIAELLGMSETEAGELATRLNMIDEDLEQIGMTADEITATRYEVNVIAKASVAKDLADQVADVLAQVKASIIAPSEEEKSLAEAGMSGALAKYYRGELTPEQLKDEYTKWYYEAYKAEEEGKAEAKKMALAETTMSEISEYSLQGYTIDENGNKVYKGRTDVYGDKYINDWEYGGSVILEAGSASTADEWAQSKGFDNFDDLYWSWQTGNITLTTNDVTLLQGYNGNKSGTFDPGSKEDWLAHEEYYTSHGFANYEAFVDWWRIYNNYNSLEGYAPESGNEGTSGTTEEINAEPPEEVIIPTDSVIISPEEPAPTPNESTWDGLTEDFTVPIPLGTFDITKYLTNDFYDSLFNEDIESTLLNYGANMVFGTLEENGIEITPELEESILTRVGNMITESSLTELGSDALLEYLQNMIIDALDGSLDSSDEELLGNTTITTGDFDNSTYNAPVYNGPVTINNTYNNANEYDTSES